MNMFHAHFSNHAPNFLCIDLHYGKYNFLGHASYHATIDHDKPNHQDSKTTRCHSFY